MTKAENNDYEVLDTQRSINLKSTTRYKQNEPVVRDPKEPIVFKQDTVSKRQSQEQPKKLLTEPTEPVYMYAIRLFCLTF
jgi:hypothetical protein